MRYEIPCFYSVIATNQNIANLENRRIMQAALEVLSIPSRRLSFAGKLTRVGEHMRFMARKVDLRIEMGFFKSVKLTGYLFRIWLSNGRAGARPHRHVPYEILRTPREETVLGSDTQEPTEDTGFRMWHGYFSLLPENWIVLTLFPGIWCIDMADEYPSAEVIGIDIAPTQPKW
jgi:hypothetical protein